MIFNKYIGGKHKLEAGLIPFQTASCCTVLVLLIHCRSAIGKSLALATCRFFEILFALLCSSCSRVTEVAAMAVRFCFLRTDLLQLHFKISC